jgi:hypothetical protein
MSLRVLCDCSNGRCAPCKGKGRFPSANPGVHREYECAKCEGTGRCVECYRGWLPDPEVSS